MVEIKRIGILSFAKLYSLVMAIFGLLMGIFFAIFGKIISSVANSNEFAESGMTPSADFATFGFMSIIIIPVIYAIIGFIGGAIGAFIYNMVAKITGGIDIELSK